MSCHLLWNSSSHFLYRCNETVACEAIDNQLYICTSLRTENYEKNQTETKSPTEDTTNNTISVEGENVSTNTNTPQLISTTRVYQYQTTTQNPSTVSSSHTTKFLPQTTTVKLTLSTTTNIPKQNPEKDPVTYTTKNYNISTTPTKKLSHTAPAQTSIVPALLFTCFGLLGIVAIILQFYKKKIKRRRKSNVIPVNDEVDLEHQFQINAWRMKRLHKYLQKKHPEKKMVRRKMIEETEKYASLMEKIHIEIKKSPKRDIIYKKKREKRVPTMTADFSTVMKEPEKIKHISSVAKLKIKMLPVEYAHRRKRKNFKILRDTLLPAAARRRRPPPKPPIQQELKRLRSKNLVSKSVFMNEQQNNA